jgi:hypothetical protein
MSASTLLPTVKQREAPDNAPRYDICLDFPKTLTKIYCLIKGKMQIKLKNHISHVFKLIINKLKSY